MDVGIITAVIFFLAIMVLQAVEQRRSGYAYRKALADSKARANGTADAYRKALADSKARANETAELQRETNRLLTLIAEKMDAPQK